MEPYHLCANGVGFCNVMEIIPMLLNTENSNVRVKPSDFLKEMNVSVEERLEKLKKVHCRVKNLTDFNIQTFRISPEVIIFQNFEIGRTYSAILNVLNLREISTPLRISRSPSQYFNITHSTETVCTKIAPGMSYQFKISFNPEELTDYKYSVTFITETESFEVHVLAIGPRPLLNFPDEIHLPKTAVRIGSEKTIMVRNIGQINAPFVVTCTPPFSLFPTKGILNPNELMQLTVHFSPDKIGFFESNLTVSYETGEKLCIKVSGIAEDAQIHFEKSLVKFEDTYMSLTNQKTFELFNKSKYIIKFKWKQYSSPLSEMKKVTKLKTAYKEMSEFESKRCTKLEWHDIIDYEGNSKVYERIYQDEVDELAANEEFFYQSSTFKIIPMTGEIWPNRSLVFNLLFSPEKAGIYEEIAYLDIKGCEKRKAISLCGRGVGPRILLNVKEINANKIFVCTRHQYEVVVGNKSPIPADVAFQPHQDLCFGGQISCFPQELHLAGGEYKTFTLQFTSRHEGKFVEEVQFNILNSQEKLKLILSGQVVAPLLSFSLSEIDFGCIPVGFSVTKKVDLINPSQIAVPFEMFVKNDGFVKALTCQQFADQIMKTKQNRDPKEFECSPSDGLVPPNSRITIKLTLTPNVVRKQTTELSIRMWERDRQIVFIPIKYDANVPILQCTPSEISIKFCFIKYSYNRTITIKNTTGLPGYYFIVPPTKYSEDTLTFKTDAGEGFIGPHEIIEIPLRIIMSVLGSQQILIHIIVFGAEPTQYCNIKCIGQGPVVSTDPENVTFGKVTLLETVSKEIVVLNDCPVSAAVNAVLPEKSLYTVTPSYLMLDPLTSQKIVISVYLTNPGKHVETLELKIDQADSVECNLQAVGVGTSILCEPRVQPELDLGYRMTHQKVSFSVKFTNKGRRRHKLFWSRHEVLKNIRVDAAEPIISTFSFNPDSFELDREESIVVQIEGQRESVGLIEEDFYCHAMIEGSNKRTIIISSIVKATFVHPTLEYSKQQLLFRSDVQPETLPSTSNDEVTIINRTKLPLDMDMYLDLPFNLLINDQVLTTSTVHLEDDESLTISVGFDPTSDVKKCFAIDRCLTLDYHDHPHTGAIKLRGEVNYPHVEIDSTQIEFALYNYTSDYREIVLKNISPLCVLFEWEWIEDSFEEATLEPMPIKILNSEKSSSNLTLLSSESTIALPNKQATNAESENDKPIENTDPHLTTHETQNNENDIKKEVYHHAAIEDERTLEYLQTQYTVPSAIRISDVISEPEKSREYFNAMREKLYPIVACYDDDVEDEDIELIKTLPKNKKQRGSIDEVLDIIPYKGCLEPFECQVVSISFTPKPNTFVKAKAFCHVFGGESETVSIEGTTSEVSYTLVTDFVEFGKQVFCEICERSITLTNTGYTDFKFDISHQETQMSVEDGILPPGWLSVVPQSGTVVPGATILIKIEYFPGEVVEFNKQLMLQIGCLPSIPITLHGYGVFSQLIFSLPRPYLAGYENDLKYTAVATLTPDFLWPSTNDSMDKYANDISKDVRRRIESEGWVVVFYKDEYPTITDIDLSIERVLANQHVCMNPSVLIDHTFKQKTMIIPHLMMPPYLIDFGYVVFDNIVHYSVLLLNYGPINSYVKLKRFSDNKYKHMVLEGFMVQFVNSTISVGETKELSVIFNPKKDYYACDVCKVMEEITFEVKHGPQIPVILKAIVCFPRVECDFKCIDFGKVRCGDCLKRSVIISNSGYVESRCKYTITLRRKPKKDAKSNDRGVFFLKNTAVDIPPEKEILLDIFFEPDLDGWVHANLVIHICENPEELIVPIKGYGMVPTLKIQDESLSFDPVLPYTVNCEKYFTIENTNSFPIELYFSDFDTEVDQEERILRIILQHYDMNDLYIPARVAGKGLPQPIINYYQMLVERLRDKLIRDEKSDSIAKSESKDSFEITSRKEHTSIISKSTARSTSIVDAINPLGGKSEADIEALLKQHLEESKEFVDTSKTNLAKEETLHAAFLEIKTEEEKKPTDVRKSVVLIFHGAPNTKYLEAANLAGRTLNVPTYNLDQLFVEALVSNSSLAANKVNEIIQDEFMNIASETDLTALPEEDEFDSLWKKIDLILSGKEKKPPPKSPKSLAKKDSNKSKKGSSKSSKSSTKKGKSSKSSSKKTSKSSKGSGKKQKKKEDTDTLLNIPIDLLQSVVAQRVEELATGVVLESLDSKFIKKPLIALNMFLKSIRNVQYIHFILLSYTLEELSDYNQKLKLLQEEQSSKEKSDILQKIIEMDATEFANLSAEHKSLYQEHVLKQRKVDTLRKREELRLRLLEPAKHKRKSKEKRESVKPASSKHTTTTPLKESGKKSGSKSKSSKTKSSKTKSSKSTKKSKSSSKKGSKGEKKKSGVVDKELKELFDNFEDLQFSILHTLEYWDRKRSLLIKELPQVSPKKSKSVTKKRSKGSSKGSTRISSKTKKVTQPPSKTNIALSSTAPSITSDEMAKMQEIGVPCWIIRNANEQKPVQQIVTYYLQNTSQLKEAIQSAEESLHEFLEETTELFTVLHSPEVERTKSVSEVFVLSDAPDNSDAVVHENSSVDQNSIVGSTRKSIDSKITIESKGRRRGLKKPKKIPFEKASMASSTGKSCDEEVLVRKLTSRCVLQPGENARYRLTFSPKNVGTYKHKYAVEAVGWPNKYYLHCEGTCDIPKIDMSPEAMFSRIIESRIGTDAFEPLVFVKELDVFDFGNILLCNADKENDEAAKTEFQLNNISLLPCELSISLRNSSKIFNIEPRSLTIEPGATNVLKVSASPNKKATFENELSISVRYNPKTESVKLACTGCKIRFSVDPKSLEFQRVSVNVKQKKKLTLLNESGVPCAWKFDGLELEEILDNFVVSAMEGVVPPCDTQDVTFQFQSSIPMTFPRIRFKILVFDFYKKCQEILHKETLELCAEAVDQCIECPKEINLGEIAGNTLHKIPFKMYNAGSYSVQFVIEENVKGATDEIKKLFTVSPLTGIISSKQSFEPAVTFKCSKPVKFSAVPIFKCSFTDIILNTLVDSFLVTARAKTYFSSFEIHPVDEMHFGQQLISSEKVQTIAIKNIGKAEFSYNIISLSQILYQKEKKKDKKISKQKSSKKGSKKDSKKGSKGSTKGSKDGSKKKSGEKTTGSGKGSKKSSEKKSKGSKSSKKGSKKSKSSQSSKGKKSAKEKVKITKLDAGPFMLIPSTGKVLPGESAKIEVHSIPKELKNYSETIVIFISECSLQDRKGKQIVLNVEGALPELNFTNPDFIFKETYVVNSFNELQVKNSTAFAAYIVDETQLFFDHVYINTSHSVRLCIQNKSAIATVINASVVSEKERVFNVQPTVANIEPYSTVYLTVTFTPNAIEHFTGTLEVTYISPLRELAKRLTVNLSGSGYIPEVELVHPEPNEVTNACSIVFNATLLGSNCTKDIKFKNIGDISCKVIIEVCNDFESVFALKPKCCTIKLLTVWDEQLSEAMKHTNLVKLSPGETAEFELWFEPKNTACYSCAVKLHIVDNPFELFLIEVKGEGYNEDITIEGLPIVPIRNEKSNTSCLDIELGYELHFSYGFVNVLQKKCFKIANRSQEFVYRFEFPTFDKLVFIPAIGHLAPKSSKEIICTLLTEEPLVLENIILSLLTHQIEYCNQEQAALSWDERQNVIIWKPTAETLETESSPDDDKASEDHEQTNLNIEECKLKCIEERQEPEIETIPDSNKCIPITLSAVCGYLSYECSITEIAFSDTFALNKRSLTFEVLNTSVVPLNINWTIEMHECYPIRINAELQNQDEKVSSEENVNLVENKLSRNMSLQRKQPMPLFGEERLFNSAATISSSCDDTSLFSAKAQLSNRSNDSWCEHNPIPFTITPNPACIPPEQQLSFKVTFAPLDVFQYEAFLQSRIQNLKPKCPNIDVLLKGRSILPLCHFDIESVDIEEIREGRKLCGEKDEHDNLKIVKFEAIGLKETNIQKFGIMNPTDEAFSYKWTPSTLNETGLSFFNCHTPHGTIAKGKTAEAIFSFVPQTFGTYEAFYNFHIKKWNLTRSFLLFGVARNPNVHFEKPHVTMKPTILGVDATDEVLLKNEDHADFAFKFSKESLYSGGHLESIKIQPMHGLLKAGYSQLIRISFHPRKMGETNFSVKCLVEKSSEPISLGVTCSCYKVEAIVSCETDDGQKHTLSSHKVNHLELKSMIPNQKQSFAFNIANIGKTGLYFVWSIKDETSDKFRINFKDQEGYVMSNSEVISSLNITLLKNTFIDKFRVKLQIPYGPIYVIRISGTPANAMFHFSFEDYNFGPCLVQKEPTNYYSTTLKFTNNDANPLTLEYNFKKLEHVTVKFTSNYVMPKKSERIPIYFHPMEVTHYQNQIPFYVNSKIYAITIHGEGVPLRVELVNPVDKFVDFGAVVAGRDAIKKIRVMNKSAVDIDIIFDVWDRLPYYYRSAKMLEEAYELQEVIVPVKPKSTKGDKKKGKNKPKSGKKSKESSKSSKGSKSTKKDKKKGGKKKKSESSKSKTSKSSKSKSSKGGKQKSKKAKKEKEMPTEEPQEEVKETEEQKQARLLRTSLSVAPKKFQKVYPHHTVEIELRFAPTERMKHFTEKISYQVQDTTELLCMVKGCSIGAEFNLDRNCLAFGDVIFRCTSEQNVILRNVGDIGGSFKWVFENRTTVFSVTPKEGFISAQSEVIISVSFVPQAIECSYKATVKCVIEQCGITLPLQLIGACVSLPPPKEILEFQCPVREQDKKSVQIVNPTCCSWVIKPILHGITYFSTSATVPVAPNSSNFCQVTYKPTRMTYDTFNHEAILFLPLPEGGGLTYKLVGTAMDPLPAQKYYEEIQCKTDFSKLLSVCNWASDAQELKVMTENVSQQSSSMIPYKVTGNSVIKVAHNGIRDYKWTIRVLKEGSLAFKVTFTNENTREYLFYEIDLLVTKRESLDDIRLTTCVRRPVTYCLKLENPIKVPVVYSISCEHRYLEFENSVEIPALSEYELKVVYNPLKPEDEEVLLEAKAEELGSYPYTFKLKANLPVPEPAIHFKTFLGQSVSQTVYFTNTLNTRIDFSANFDDDVFWLSKPIAVAAQEKGSFEICFEPDSLGTLQSRLLIYSSLVGQYIYPLVGICMLPKPQGPFLLQPGSSTAIVFKNPFKEMYNFNFCVDPDVFYVNTASESIKPKKKIKVIIGMKQYEANTSNSGDAKYPKTGKMTVKCSEPTLAHIKWTFYLQENFSTGSAGKVSKTSLKESVRSLPVPSNTK